MHSVFGGSHPKDGACQAPRSGVDWILGNRWVRFGAARVDRSPLVQATTDHPVVSAPVELLPGPATLPPPVPTAPAPNVPTPSPSADD
jgi:hypothetical protein